MNKIAFTTLVIFIFSFGYLATEAGAEIKRAKKPEDPNSKKTYVHPCSPGTEQFGEYGSKVVCRQPMTGGRFRAEGNMTAWHANGNKKIEGDYIRGDKHGVWTTYHRNGKIKWVETYYAGQRQTRTKFDRLGNPIIPAKEQQAQSQQSTQAEKKKKRLSWRFMRK